MTAIAVRARQRHVLAFGKPLGLTDEQIDATVVGDSATPPGRVATRSWSSCATSSTRPTASRTGSGRGLPEGGLATSYWS
jgi:hypothetical protein